MVTKFSPEELEQIEQWLYDLDEEDICELEIVKGFDSKGEVVDIRGPMMWLRRFTKTENYHWMAQGLQPKEAFPYKPHPGSSGERANWDYLDWLMLYLLEGFKLAQVGEKTELDVAKTREMMSSWEVVGYITWACQFFPNTQALGQSEKDEKAQGLVKYANILYDNQPSWLKSRHPLRRGDAGTAHKIQWANGSEFIAVPQGERQVASFHPTIYFNDESAHQPAWKATVNVVKPVAKQIICVSSAAASDFGIECDPSKAE